MVILFKIILKIKPTDYSWFQVNEHGPGHVLALPRFAEEGGKLLAPTLVHLVRERAVGGKPVLETVELPARVADLNSGLPHVDGYTFSLCCLLFLLFINRYLPYKTRFNINNFGHLVPNLKLVDVKLLLLIYFLCVCRFIYMTYYLHVNLYFQNL